MNADEAHRLDRALFTNLEHFRFKLRKEYVEFLGDDEAPTNQDIRSSEDHVVDVHLPGGWKAANDIARFLTESSFFPHEGSLIDVKLMGIEKIESEKLLTIKPASLTLVRKRLDEYAEEKAARKARGKAAKDALDREQDAHLL